MLPQLRLALIILLIGVALLGTLIILNQKKKKSEKSDDSEKQHTIIKKLYVVITIAALTIGTVSSCLTGYLALQAKSHGMTPDDIKNDASIASIIESNNKSPVESKLPDNFGKLKGSIIIYYRYGCPDCEAIFDKLSEQLKDKENIYWVSTQTEQGKKLLKKYKVNEVPSGIYIRKKSYNPDFTYTTKLLFKKENNKQVLDEKSVKRLLELQKQRR